MLFFIGCSFNRSSRTKFRGADTQAKKGSHQNTHSYIFECFICGISYKWPRNNLNQLFIPRRYVFLDGSCAVDGCVASWDDPPFDTVTYATRCVCVWMFTQFVCTEFIFVMSSQFESFSIFDFFLFLICTNWFIPFKTNQCSKPFT